MFTEELKREKIKKRTEDQWKERSQVQGIDRMKLPKLEWKKVPPLWKSKNRSSKTKPLLLKQYIGKLPIPRRGGIVPRKSARQMAHLMKNRETWTKQNEEEINRLAKLLLECTSHHTPPERITITPTN